MTAAPRWAVVVLAAAAIWGGATAGAQPAIEGRVTRDRAVIWDAESPIALVTVEAGTLLEITAQSERWYEVIVPESLGGRGRRGLIARSQVELLDAAARPPTRSLRGDPIAAPPAPQSIPAARAPAPPRRSFARGFASVNGALRATSNDFTDAVPFRLHAEDGRFETDYSVDASPGFSAAAGAMISPVVGIGVSVARFARATPASFTAEVPHPFFFDTPRAVSAEIPRLRRGELAAHVQVRGVWPMTDRVEVAVSGGPSLFRVAQDLVSTFAYEDAYPYDAAAFRSAQSVAASGTRAGFNVGGDVAVFLSRRVGVGVNVLFSRATVDLRVSEERTARARAGGLHTGAGLRLRF